MDLSNVVCLYRLALEQWPQCSPVDAPVLLNSTGFLESVVHRVETCPTEQLAICREELSNVTITLPSIQIGPSSPVISVPASNIALRLGVELFAAFFQLALTIPLRVFLWIMSMVLFHIQQLTIDLFVHRKLQAFLITTTAILLITLIRRRLTYWRSRNIPFECFTAHLSHFQSLSSFLPFDDVSRVKRFGTLFGSFKLTKPVLCIADHRVIEQILYTKSDYFTGQNTWQLEGHLLAESIFTNSTPDIQRWKRKKAILLSSFLSRKIKLLAPTIDGLTEELLGYLRLQLCSTRKGATWKTNIDSLVFPWLVYSLSALILDIDLPKYHMFVQGNELSSRLIGSCRRFVRTNRQMRQSALFSLAPFLRKLVNLHLLSSANRRQMQTVLNDAIEYRLDNGLLGLTDTGSKRPSKRRSVKFRDEVYSSLIAAGKTEADGESEATSQRPASPPAQLKELTFIDIILNYEIEPEDKLEGYDFSRQELLDNLVAFFTVSLSTLSSAISGVLFYLALHSVEQHKVRQEVVDCIGTRENISWESLRNLKYTEAFIKEVLRLTSPIERIERTVTKSCTVDTEHGQLTLSPGLQCTILVAAVHRNGEHYPEPNAFKPSRFYSHEQVPESPGIEKPGLDGSKFLAFGMGSRTCIGLKFVMFYLKHLIANVLLEYELKMAKNMKRHIDRPIDTHSIVNSNVELSMLKKQTSKRHNF